MTRFFSFCVEIVHEDLKMGSDGESDQASGSSDEVQSPVRVRMRNNAARKISTEVKLIGFISSLLLFLYRLTT